MFNKNYLGHDFKPYLRHILNDYYKCDVCSIRAFYYDGGINLFKSEITGSNLDSISCEKFIIKTIIE